MLHSVFVIIFISNFINSDIPGYDLPAINFVSPLEEAQESHILEEEEDATIYTLRRGACSHD